MLIYDSFPSRETAKEFQDDCVRLLGRKALVRMSQAASDKIDPFPFLLTPPIVLVERVDNLSGEDRVDCLAKQHGGVFAGT
jgi:hypothetical protein